MQNKQLDIIETRRDIWRYARLLPGAPSEPFRIPGNNAFTPVIPWTRNSRVNVLIKREDRQPTGSHKDRAACFQLSCLSENNQRAAVISSSGNAARSVSAYARKTGCRIVAFMAHSAVKEKIAHVAAEGSHVLLSGKPVNFARYASRIFHVPNLRPSGDVNAVRGFMSLGFEIFEQFRVTPPDAVFIFTTSGATLLGVFNAFELIVEKFALWETYPQLHAVQSGKSRFLADVFDPRKNESADSPAGQGGLARSGLTPQLTALIRKTRGSAWGIQSREIHAAQRELAERDIHTSPEGAAALAAVKRWREAGGGTALVIFTGEEYADSAAHDPRLISEVTSYLDVRSSLREILHDIV